MLNLLVSHLANQTSAPALEAVFSQLKEYTIIHFHTEEQIWKKYFCGDNWEEWHKNSHGDFIAEIIKLKQEENIKPLEEVIEDIVRFLTHWLAFHILEGDKRMAKVVLALPTGVSLAQAKERADQEMLGATRVLIDTIMSMYDTLASQTVRLTREINKRQKAEAELLIAKEQALIDKERADAANRSKSAFLAYMSHEIRTPLNAIIGLVYLMKREGLIPDQKKCLAKISYASKHLLSLINDILDLSRIESGKFQTEESEIVVETLVNNIASILMDRINEKNLVLVVDNDIIPGNLLGDSTRIQQALLNYANNAIKFTEKGSIILRTRKLAETDDSILVRFEVQDTGIGVEKNAINRLFNYFEQADYSTTRLYGGTGLGLAITKGLAELMGGTVGAESVFGLGSTFWFTVMLKKGGHSIIANDQIQEGMADKILGREFSGSKVLVVEDEPINMEVSMMLVESVGLSVEGAENGLKALEMVVNNDYALVLMDMMMPGMDGLETSRQIRKQAKNMPIIALTGNVFKEEIQRCLDAGMNDFITKPVYPEQLYLTLLKWLRFSKSKLN